MRPRRCESWSASLTLVAVALFVCAAVTGPLEATAAGSGGKAVPIRGLASPISPIRSGDTDALRIELLERQFESALRVRQELGPHPMSRKGLARRDARVRGLLRRATPAPDTLKVLLIRIAFREDRSGSLTSITEDGNFLLEPDPEIFFDPPPHDRRFFEAQAIALREYWASVSNGQIVAETIVLPPADEDAYFLSDIADYGPGSGGFWTIERLERLVQDMIRAADAGTLGDGSANLADYDFDNPDTHVIFAHAGGDLQSNLVWTPGQPGYSPNDIPTFFVTLGDSAVVDLESTDSITGERGLITECSVIPESVSQDGLVGAITAALVHEFGHALGLPDLYSTTTGLPTVGLWGIMDSGTNLGVNILVPDAANPGEYIPQTVTGILPPMPTIWSRWYLGLVDERRIGGEEVEMDLPASFRQDTREKVLRLDVSPDEYFLVENRWVPPTLDPDLYGLTADPQSGVVLFLGDYDQDLLLGNSHLYDAFMPFYGGVMIWRVRQDRVEAGMEFNTVQGTPTRLGVELVEADGIKDIGVADFATRGFLGSDTDAFRTPSSFVYEGETIPVPGTSSEFTPDSFPPSQSSFRIPTGARVTGIGPMTDQSANLRAGVDDFLHTPDAGTFPVEFPGATSPEGLPIVSRGGARSLGSVDVGGRTALLATARIVDESAPHALYAYDRAGQPFLATPRVADLPGEPSGAPLLSDQPVAQSLITVSRAGEVSVFDAAAGFLPVMVAQLDSIDTQPLLLAAGDRAWVFGASRSRNTASAIELTDASPVPVDFALPAGEALEADPVLARDGSGTHGVVLLHAGRIDLRGPDGLSLDPSNWPIALPAAGAPDSSAWLATLPGVEPGEGDRIVIVNERGRISLVQEKQGAYEASVSASGVDGAPVGEVVVADVDGDGRQDLVIATQDRLWAMTPSGTRCADSRYGWTSCSSCSNSRTTAS